MRSCRKASELTAQQFDRPLTWREKLGLVFHRMICAPCRLYLQQMQRLRSEVGNLEAVSEDSHELDRGAKERIREKLQSASKR